MTICPCGSTKVFQECCDIFLSGAKNPETPEQLMRSRYSAFTLSMIDYIEKTMRGPATKDFNKASTHEWTKNIVWQKLEIVSSNHHNDQGVVEFKAYYFMNGKNHVLHEISEFQRDNNKWYYIQGKHPESHEITYKIGRNEPCPCGSQIKYKKCCLIK